MCHGTCEPGMGCAGVHVSSGASESHRARVAGRIMESGESGAAVSWRAARNDARNRPTHAVAARLVVLGLAVTVGMATLSAVFREKTGWFALCACAGATGHMHTCTLPGLGACGAPLTLAMHVLQAEACQRRSAWRSCSRR